MKIAVAQLVADADPGTNLGQIAERTEQAVGLGAELVVFPEATMRCFGRSLTEIAEPLDGPWAAGVRDVAARHAVTVVAGMFTPAPGGKVTNTLLVTGPDVRAHYDKIHLYDAFGFAESDTVVAGTAPVTVTVADTVVGLATCYDLRFPGLFTALADRGATVVVVPASWGAGPGKLDQWRLLVRARALDTTTYVVAVGQADPASLGRTSPKAAPTGIGHSLVAGPDGSVLLELGAAPELTVVDLDPDLVIDVRRRIPVLANRRI